MESRSVIMSCNGGPTRGRLKWPYLNSILDLLSSYPLALSLEQWWERIRAENGINRLRSVARRRGVAAYALPTHENGQCVGQKAPAWLAQPIIWFVSNKLIAGNLFTQVCSRAALLQVDSVLIRTFDIVLWRWCWKTTVKTLLGVIIDHSTIHTLPTNPWKSAERLMGLVQTVLSALKAIGAAWMHARGSLGLEIRRAKQKWHLFQ